jgi:hypothetical protein
MGKIRANQPPVQGGRIPAPKPPLTDDKMAFSFKHLDLTSTKFSLAHCKTTYLQKFLERLKALNGMVVDEIRSNKSKSIRAHSIDWSDTSEKSGFSTLNDQLRNLPAWQFEISSNEHGRVHGFFIDRTFFVVWIDPNHLLYS